MLESNAEISFIKEMSEYPSKTIFPNENSRMEGFEYFSTEEFKSKLEESGQKIVMPFFANGFSGFFKLMAGFAKNIKGIKNGQNESFIGIEDYIQSLQTLNPITTPKSIKAEFPNEEIWGDLKDYAWKKHRVIIGFTEVPNEFIFTEKVIPFKYALVCIAEMNKEKIEKAPKVDAGVEVISVYNSLGQAANDIAKYMRERFDILCMANHPLGGLVDTSPLGEKAGMGMIGHNGLLITPEFGPRCRIATIFVEKKVFNFTDNTEHDWISKFCDACRSCQKGCPQNAILEEKIVDVNYNSNYRNRMITIDRGKCFLYFRKTMGCSLCIKNCPFSKNPKIYESLKKRLK